MFVWHLSTNADSASGWTYSS